MDRSTSARRRWCSAQLRLNAALVRDLINQMKTSERPELLRAGDGEDGALGDQWLRTFQDNEKTIPTILTTSQKLSTGVDARNVRNIVLMRPINSMIEFKQIIGRGTRLFDGKDYFTIYDFVKAYEHFNDPEWDGEPMEPVARSRDRRDEHGMPGARRRVRADAEAAEKDQNQACRRQGAHHPAHDGDQATGARTESRSRPTRCREIVRRVAALLQGRGRAAAAVEQARYPQGAAARARPKRASAQTSSPKSAA